MKKILFGSCLLALASATTVAFVPTDAHACGGTFCDGGVPTPMPVDQSGENILFVLDDGYIEAHIQIQYTGDPDKFGWVIPLQAEPDDIAPGSEALFANLLAATVPAYGFTTQFDQCNALGDGGGAPDAGFGGSSGGGGDGTGGAEPPGVEVLSMQQVGSFEITVLQGTDAQAVVDWLDANEYQQDPDAVPILQEYIDEGHVFAAVKLTDGAGLGEIHPIALRFRSSEPCVPLRLTRIAAVENMEIRSFFLGEARTVPRTYRHVEINQLKLDWPNSAANYKEEITLAVDEKSADGRAFVTEYAGPSDVVSTAGLVSTAWNADAFRTIAAVDVIDELKNQGLWACGFDPITGGDVCGGQHPLVQGLLDQYLPVPAGVDPLAFYDCVMCFEGQIDPTAWDGTAFADAMQDKIIDPGMRAQQVLQLHPYLTRMYTTISPAEMTEDPMFWQNPDLEDVDNTNSMATRRVLCNGDAIWTLPDGREVYLPQGATWPEFDDLDGGTEDEPTRMPVAELITEVPNAGAPMELANNTKVIDAKLAAYNAKQGWDGSDPGAGSGSGCGCTTGDRGAGLFWLMMTGFGLAVARRRS